MDESRIIVGDSIEKLKQFPANCFDSVVTDPPYGWRFMGKAWDAPDIENMAKAATGKEPRLCADGRWRKPRADCKSIAAGKYDERRSANFKFQEWTEAWAREVFRVLKPGGHILVFCGPRTYHRMAAGIEDAGFEIRDQLQWIFGSGFPKSHNVGGGFGTALKPANEPICLARKPLSEKTVAKNVLKHGTGAINIDESRIGTTVESWPTTRSYQRKEPGENNKGIQETGPAPQGRWPANILFDETAASGHEWSKFFYVAKASKRERNAGLEGEAKQKQGARPNSKDATGKFPDHDHRPSGGNNHPTVKPVKLMEYLVKLITPPGGIVLDPFAGSGSTGVACKKTKCRFVGIELNKEYAKIAKRRLCQKSA